MYALICRASAIALVLVAIAHAAIVGFGREPAPKTDQVQEEPPAGTRVAAVNQPLKVHGPFQISARQLRNLPQPRDEARPWSIHEDSPELTAPCTGFPCFELAEPSYPQLRAITVDTWTAADTASDPQIAVSNTHVVVARWDRMYIYTKAGTLLETVTAEDLYEPLIDDLNDQLNVPNTAQYGIDRFFDSRIIYDDFRDRFWFVTLGKQLKTDDGTNPGATNADKSYRRSKVLVGVSATSDPSAAWRLYWFDGVMDDGACNAPDEPVQSVLCPGSQFHPGDGFDFSFIGISERYFMESNKVGAGAGTKDNPNDDNYILLNVVSAQQLADGTVPEGGIDAWQFGRIHYPDGVQISKSLLQPAVHHDPSGPSYLVSLRKEAYASGEIKEDELQVWSLFTLPNGRPALVHNAVPVQPWQKPADAHQPVHPNINPPRRLDTLPAHYAGKAVHRDSKLYATWADCQKRAMAPDCLSTVRVVGIPTPGGPGLPFFDESFAGHDDSDIDSSSDSSFLPSLEVNRFGHLAAVFQRSGKLLAPEARVAFKLAHHATMSGDRRLRRGNVPVGTTATDSTAVRSIDVAGMSVDPFDDEAIWMVHGYARPKNGTPATTNRGEWGMVVGKIFGDRYPDLMVRTVEPEGSKVAPGQPVTVDFAVGNEGDRRANNVVVELLLVESGAPRTAAINLGRMNVGSIDPGGTATASRTITMPAGNALKQYFVRVRVDPDDVSTEYDETNNLKATRAITVTGS